MNIERYISNFSKEDFVQEYDLIIIGSGVGGLTAAYYTPESFKVALFTKDKLEESNTYYAQGGIAVALSPNDSPELHFRDTILAGADFCEEKIVKIVVNEGIDRVKDLIRLGAIFDKKDGLSFTREAAHSRRRIIHAHGDATGYEVARALIEAVEKKENLDLFEEHMLLELLTKDDTVIGGVFWDIKEKRIDIILAKYTILATGGAGQIYANTTNPLTTTGDGISSAYRVGARVMDLEFFQFHPTALKMDAPQRFLISESVRGEGGILINSFGERFMLNYHPLGDLAPRDVVTRAMYIEMIETQKDIYIDFRPVGDKKIKERFPNIYRKCLEYGYDITKEPIPVAPTAHYYMGGIETDEYGRTSLKNLYACGEVACTGLHGANRLASNSLLEALVFGKRCIDAVLSDKPAKTNLNIQRNISLQGKEFLDCDKRISKLKNLLWEKAGILREEKELKEAKREIENLIDEVYGITHKSRNFYEYKNMLILDYLIVNSALLRRESRGAHFRIDFPKMEDSWRKHIVWEKDKEVIYREVNSLPSFKKNSRRSSK
ncbi:MAG TPA: L-aspartate oxidase [Dictyoglomaceae bacterium]|nr:L-aspartate oxidase [Dictyoglomaceae bacterium]HOL38986.1 L-aspartate oxidase [Dictyoglomaceae bacterium]HOP94325.1 L-aspartate oxidase [Dictyoglomaceae bacterium]HPP15838.1 L-aspartate oxidase [Dictyoglomaceae bacterium]HPU42827.1 L-aspartate oxidase [Dictyoglomaceae bacterium]